jgi:hypothetical protein
MYVMTVFAKYLSSSDNRAPAAERTVNKRAENPAKVIIRPANAYKNVSPLNSMFLLRFPARRRHRGNLDLQQGLLKAGLGVEHAVERGSESRGLSRLKMQSAVREQQFVSLGDLLVVRCRSSTKHASAGAAILLLAYPACPKNSAIYRPPCTWLRIQPIYPRLRPIAK